VYQVVEDGDYAGTKYHVLTKGEHESVHESVRQDFVNEGSATHPETKTTYLTPEKASKTTISSNVRVSVSSSSADSPDYLGNISDFLSSAYKFSRKSKPHTAPTISLLSSVPHAHRLVDLARTRNQTREWGNGRGDVEGTPQYFTQIAETFGKEHNLKVTVISGEELLKEGFRLLHAVGRASVNRPAFVNLSYNGNPDSNEWVAFVGKGVCFDSGGLDIKPGISCAI
jgi:leucyl aminopeptidase